ncbi:2-hydroxyacid dehydrogenase [Catenovulum sp. SM1970]|uniref:2-hydroxyacid dehydrogenase n=1 Tax=Marinifaba aquimaris TaxID=2741323 RepID=UPI0015743628|nr:2-hydroxyacid dehydrogenase [Marinifaba aquimaris]NTS77371.1 2-hydroxyacid dehydrogenase [Marinifaba aquimaris]
MKVAVFSTKPYDKEYLTSANDTFNANLEFEFYEAHLNKDTAILAKGSDAICCFVNDNIDADVLTQLVAFNIKDISLRCAGFNQVDLDKAKELGIRVARVPEYSPHAIAEHALALILALNRNIHRAHTRIRENDYSIHGLLGFDLHGKTVAVFGTGKIGATFAKVMKGLGCNVVAYDPYPNPDLLALDIPYVNLDQALNRADIISLHCPLMPETQYLINDETLAKTKKGVMVINTSRGGLIDTKAIIRGLKTGQVGYVGLDVYEEEGDLFFDDLSNQLLQDDVFARLLTFPNVVITGHQAFFTKEALINITDTVVQNLMDMRNNQIKASNRVA